MTSMAPLNFATTPGQKVAVENTGVKRILGVNLLQQGKVANWQYFLEDIKSVVVYANDGTDVWYGTFGQPVAGPVAVRDSLVPFEGQRFYTTDEDLAYEYKGGSWTGTVFEGNLIGPTYLILKAPQKLTVGRKHLIDSNGEYSLPTANVKDGHEIEFEAYDGNAVTVTTEDGSDIVLGDIIWDVSANGALDIDSSVVYRGVYYSGVWSLFFTSGDDYLRRESNLNDIPDIQAARDSLVVFSKIETEDKAKEVVDDVTVGSGLVKTGTAAGENMVLSVAFASATEAEDTSIADKALSPATIVPTVNTANRENQHNNITGLLPASGEAKFSLTGTVNGTTLSWPEFTCAFNADPYVRSQPLTLITFPANTVAIPFQAGVFTHQVVARDDGTVVLQSTRPLKSSVNEVLLGGVITLDGQILADNMGAPTVGIYPRLASSDYALRNSDPMVSGGVFSPSATVGKVQVTTYVITEEGINWENSTVLPHTKTIPQADPAAWSEIDQNATILATAKDEVDGEFLDDQVTAVGNTNYSIQIVYTTVEGDLIVLLGQSTYPDVDAARADVFAYAPTVPAVLGNAMELARWIVRGDQYPGSGTLDLTDPNAFQSFSGLDISQASTPSAAVDITSSNTNNTLQSTNLQEQIDELSSRTSIVDLTVQVIERSKAYRVAFSGTKSLPSASPAGQIIGFYARPTDLSGILEVADTGTETIFFASDPTNTATTFAIDAAGQWFWLRSLGTQWEITNA